MRFPTPTLESHVANLNAACLDNQAAKGPHHLLSCLEADGVAQIMSFLTFGRKYFIVAAVSPQMRVDVELLDTYQRLYYRGGGFVTSSDSGLLYSFSPYTVPEADVMKKHLWWALRCGLPITLHVNTMSSIDVRNFSVAFFQKVRWLEVSAQTSFTGCCNHPEFFERESKRLKTESAALQVRDPAANDEALVSCDGLCGNLLCKRTHLTNLKSLKIANRPPPSYFEQSLSHKTTIQLRAMFNAVASLPVEELVLENFPELYFFSEFRIGCSVRSLRLPGCPLKNLQPLLKFTSLTLLDVSRNTDLFHLKGIGALHNLRVLKADDCRLTDISGVAECRHLVDLSVLYNKSLQLVFALPGLPALATLYADGCSICNVDGLHRYPSLSVVSITCDPVLQTLGGLVGAPNLSDLYVRNFQGRSLGPLARCAKLAKITLKKCGGLATLAELSGATRLITISVEWCRALRELGTLRLCPQLRSVEVLSCKNLRSLQGLIGSPSLELLKVVECSLSQVNLLALCLKLREVDVSGNKHLRSLSGLEGASSLVSVKAADCDVRIIGRLHSCPNLQDVDVSRNPLLADFQDLSGAPRLRCLVASGCQLQHLHTLKNCLLLKTIKR